MLSCMDYIRQQARKRKKILLDLEMTKEFYAQRPNWGEEIQITTSLGPEVKLPWGALPSRMHAVETYAFKLFDGVEIQIVPSIEYYGLANSILRKHVHE